MEAEKLPQELQNALKYMASSAILIRFMVEAHGRCLDCIKFTPATNHGVIVSLDLADPD